ncbi:MAG: preprotein translocase subunit SecA, partial [Thomasclavelia ramosa]
EMTVRQFTKHDGKDDIVDVAGVVDFVAKNYMLLVEVEASNCEALQKDPQKLIETLTDLVFNQYISRFNKELEPEKKLQYERSILLGVIDYTWINHIDAMTKLRNGIYLRAYAQKDPLAEYTEEAFYMFEQMTSSIADAISRNIVHMGIRPGIEEEQTIPHLKMELTFK